MTHDLRALQYASELVASPLQDVQASLDLIALWSLQGEPVDLTLALGALGTGVLQRFAGLLDVPYERALQVCGVLLADAPDHPASTVATAQQAFALLVSSQEESLARSIAPDFSSFDVMVLAELVHVFLDQVHAVGGTDPAEILEEIIVELS